MRKIVLFLALACVTFTCNAGISCRSSAVKHQFDVASGYPKGRTGYTVDHICALACGGIDAPINMQYQTKEQALRKDKWERTPEGCASTCWPFNSTKTRQVYNCNSTRKHDDK